MFVFRLARLPVSRKVLRGQSNISIEGTQVICGQSNINRFSPACVFVSPLTPFGQTARDVQRVEALGALKSRRKVIRRQSNISIQCIQIIRGQSNINTSTPAHVGAFTLHVFRSHRA